MRINFFEEYPTDENLKKAKMIDFPSTIFLAADSLGQFNIYKSKLLSFNKNIDVAYWPVLPRSYWISPFSYTKDINKFVEEIKTNKDPLIVLLDLGLPIYKNISLFIRNLFSFSRNKKIISQFLLEANKYNVSVVTAEYPPIYLFMLKIYRGLGISFNTVKYGHRSCTMYYTSMISKRIIIKNVTNTLIYIRDNLNSNLELGLGTIARGIMGNEPILSPQGLSRDLSFVKDKNFKTVTIFRLGGLNDEYYKIIKNYAS